MGFELEMIMIVHQAIGVAVPLLLLHFTPQEVEKSTPSCISMIGDLSPAGHHMVNSALIF